MDDVITIEEPWVDYNIAGPQEQEQEYEFFEPEPIPIRDNGITVDKDPYVEYSMPVYEAEEMPEPEIFPMPIEVP